MKNSVAAVADIIGRTYDTGESVVTRLGHVGLLLMMALITVNAVSRYIFNSSFPGVVQTVELYLMPLAVFFTAAALQKQNGNIKVTFIRSRLSDSSDTILQLLYRIPTLLVFGLITILAFEESVDRLVAQSTTTGVVEFPIYLSWILMLIGLVFFCLRLVIQILSDVRCLIND